MASPQSQGEVQHTLLEGTEHMATTDDFYDFLNEDSTLDTEPWLNFDLGNIPSFMSEIPGEAPSSCHEPEPLATSAVDNKSTNAAIASTPAEANIIDNLLPEPNSELLQQPSFASLQHVSIPQACSVIRNYLRSINQDESSINQIELGWHQSHWSAGITTHCTQPFDQNSLFTMSQQAPMVPALFMISNLQRPPLPTLIDSQWTVGPETHDASFLPNITDSRPQTMIQAPTASFSTTTKHRGARNFDENGIQIIAPPSIPSVGKRALRISPMGGSHLQPHIDPDTPDRTSRKGSRAHNPRPANAQLALETARSNYDNKTTPPPLSNGWVPRNGAAFSYDEFGELIERQMSVKRLRQFIYEHPLMREPDVALKSNEKDKGKMMLWLQIVPTDVSGRYQTSTRHRCRFRDCPIPRNTLGTGHIQVTFDEKWSVYGQEADPFCYAGAVHLYCLERYMNLAKLCQLPNIVVRVDNRILHNEYLRENRMKPSDTIQHIMGRFIDACRGKSLMVDTRKALDSTRYFRDYPLSNAEKSEPNYSAIYRTTLNYHCQRDWTDRKRDGEARRVFLLHMGDLAKFQNIQNRSCGNKTQRPAAIGERRSPREHVGSPKFPTHAIQLSTDISSYDKQANTAVSNANGQAGLRRSPRFSPGPSRTHQDPHSSTPKDSIESFFGDEYPALHHSARNTRSPSLHSPRTPTSNTTKSILKEPGTPRSRAAAVVTFAEKQLEQSPTSVIKEVLVTYGEANCPSKVPHLHSVPKSRKRRASASVDERLTTRLRSQ